MGALGCPARAGIGPGNKAMLGIGARLPRTRGDRPYTDHGWLSVPEVAPHARG